MDEAALFGSDSGTGGEDKLPRAVEPKREGCIQGPIADGEGQHDTDRSPEDGSWLFWDLLVELGLCPRCPLGGWGSFGGMPVHTGACAPGPGASLGSKVNRYATAAKL